MSNGSKILKWVLLSPVVLVLLSVVFCEINKAYWDHQVRLMCEKDGGVTVYEHIELTPEEYKHNGGKNGFIHVAPEEKSPTYHEYAYRSARTKIHYSSPSVWRSEYTTYRKSDGKTLGVWVTYTRHGGDIPTGIIHDSSFSCMDTTGFESNPISKIFSVKGQ